MTRVPITSPLAVLTTRTTQEHLMATHSTTDLKPGDLVQHPEHGYGVVLKNFPGVPTIYFAGKHGYENTTRGFTGWERVESTPPADEQPTSATVTLFCPDCGEAENVTVVMLGKQSNGERWFDLREFHAHTCPPVQPDEPTEFGARVTVTLPDGTREKWCRLGKHHPAPWLGETYEVPGEEWRLLCGRGTVTIGWDE